MKKLMIVLGVMAMCGCAHAADQTFYQQAYFRTNVYLHDATNTPLHLRIPTGAVVQVEGGVFKPLGALQIIGALSVDAPFRINTNGMSITYKPDAAALGTGVIVHANGSITLSCYTGTGWTNVTINPTNPLPDSMMPSSSGSNNVLKTGSTMNGRLIAPTFQSPDFRSSQGAVGSLNTNCTYGIDLNVGAFFTGTIRLTNYIMNINAGYSDFHLFGMNKIINLYGDGDWTRTARLTNTGTGTFLSGIIAGACRLSLTGDGSSWIGKLEDTQLATVSGSGSLGIGAVVATNDDCFVVGDGVVSHGDGSVSARSFWGNSNLTNITPVGLQVENTYTGGTMRLMTTNGTTFRWE